MKFLYIKKAAVILQQHVWRRVFLYLFTLRKRLIESDENTFIR